MIFIKFFVFLSIFHGSIAADHECDALQKEFYNLMEKVYEALDLQEKLFFDVSPNISTLSTSTVQMMADFFKYNIPLVVNITASITNLTTAAIMDSIYGDVCTSSIPKNLNCIYDEFVELIEDLEIYESEFEAEALEFELINRDYSNWNCYDIQKCFKENIKPIFELSYNRYVQFHEAQLLTLIRYGKFYPNFFKEYLKATPFKFFAEALGVPESEVKKILTGGSTDSSVLNCIRDQIVKENANYKKAINNLADLIDATSENCELIS